MFHSLIWSSECLREASFHDKKVMFLCKMASCMFCLINFKKERNECEWWGNDCYSKLTLKTPSTDNKQTLELLDLSMLSHVTSSISTLPVFSDFRTITLLRHWLGLNGVFNCCCSYYAIPEGSSTPLCVLRSLGSLDFSFIFIQHWCSKRRKFYNICLGILSTHYNEVTRCAV